MSGIVLFVAVRQNLLSLSRPPTCSRPRNRSATGKKVNTALDNPTNFFTAQSLDARAGDINNLLDGIGNGVQVLQAANTGITSLQKLVDTTKSSPTRRCRPPSATPPSRRHASASTAPPPTTCSAPPADDATIAGLRSTTATAPGGYRHSGRWARWRPISRLHPLPPAAELRCRYRDQRCCRPDLHWAARARSNGTPPMQGQRCADRCASAVH